jgi:hypothetical protein
VLSIPFSLRYRLAYDSSLVRDVAQIFVRAAFSSIRRRAGIPASNRKARCSPISNERLSLLSDGRIRYKLKRRWRDGTKAVIYEPMELMERLAALVPPPRFNIVRYYGVLASASSLRRYIVPQDKSEIGPAHPGCLAKVEASAHPVTHEKRLSDRVCLTLNAER